MSTIYTDAAGNKYLGDCRWGNHNISYPTTEYPLFASSQTLQEVFDDFNGVFTSAGYNNIYTPSTLPAYGTAADIYRFTLPSETDATRGFTYKHFGGNYNYHSLATANNDSLTAIDSFAWGQVIGHYQYEIASPANVQWLNYAVCCGTNSFSFVHHSPVPWQNKSFSDTEFVYYGRLLDVNPNFSYYTGYAQHTVLFQFSFQPVYNNYFGTSPESLTFSSASGRKFNHYIVGATKALLETGRATYTMSCSDGQTPGSQWATDMWVYDDNAALGYPVIGRVPNMLLGIGTYTHLKPVKIQGTAVPDNGSPWYLPVGTYAGKTLLMRCYSSM